MKHIITSSLESGDAVKCEYRFGPSDQHGYAALRLGDFAITIQSFDDIFRIYMALGAYIDDHAPKPIVPTTPTLDTEEALARDFEPAEACCDGPSL